MPLTDELGEACRAVLPPDTPKPPRELAQGFFELWLSQLAEEQPYLNVQQNLINQATFTAYSSAIAEVLEQRTDQVLRARWPVWLPPFVKAAHQMRASVVTFNYDTLIECAVGAGLLYEWGMYDPVSWTEITGDVPNWPAGAARLGATRADTFRLLKLHGSLNWYWSPGDQTGATVARRALPGTFGKPERYTEEDRRRELPGRVPFIVPPSATKSAYYRNPITHEMWQQAASRPSLTDHVVFVGYSLPLTDLTFGAMFRDTVAERSVPITVVDREPEPIVERLTAAGIDSSAITAIGGDTCVAEFVAGWIHDLGDAAADGIAGGIHTQAPVFVAWGKDRCASVLSFGIRDDAVVRRIGPTGNAEMLGRRSDAPGELIPELPTLATVIAPSKLMRVELADGSLQTVIGSASVEFKMGYPTWNVLSASGPAPEGTQQAT